MSNLKTFKVTYGNIENKVQRAYLKAYHYNEALRRAKRINGLYCIIKLEEVDNASKNELLYLSNK